MNVKSTRTSSIVLLLVSALLIWRGYLTMKVERWDDKYLFFIGLTAALMGISIICYLFIGERE